MVADVMGLAQRAHQVYSDEGLKSLLMKVPSYVTRRLWGELLLKDRYLSTEELKENAEEDGQIWYPEEEPPFQIDLPDHPELKKEFKKYPRKFSPERPFVCELRNCTLVGPYAVGLTEGGDIIGETTPVPLDKFHIAPSVYYGAPKRYLAPRILEQVFRPEPEHRLDCAFPLSCPDSSYYHWMMEYLPKIRYMERYVDETGRVPKIVVGPEPSQYVRETLEALGYGANECVEAGKGTMTTERLVVSTHRTHLFDGQSPEDHNYNLSRDDVVWLRERIRSEVGADEESERNRRIYISRQGSNRDRMVVNYDETMSLLEKRGFEPYLLEEINFKKQVKLFMQADVIMGPHGAGLVNMVFADDPTVVELHPRENIKPYFYFLSEILGFDYEPLVTDSQEKNLVVDTDDLRKHLDSIGV